MTFVPQKYILFLMMITTAVLASVMRPTSVIAKQEPAINLEVMVPYVINGWTVEKTPDSMQIVDPVQQEAIAKIYQQTLTRTYINAHGDRVMLSIAYGVDQRDSLQLHYPEVCYPAQGFEILSIELAELETKFAKIRIKRLMTQLGNRFEPVSYWSTLGNQIVRGAVEAKFAQLKYGLTGRIPDGLIFRVSSISSDAVKGYNIQALFIRELISELSTADRQKLIGLQGRK